MKNLLHATGTVSPETKDAYINYEFTVPEGIQRLRVRLEYDKPGICQLYLSVFAPDGYRGSRMLPGAYGQVVLELDLSAEFASLGGLRGEIVPGVWRAQLDLERTAYTVEYTVTADGFANAAPTTETASQTVLETPSKGAAWYRGELHCHTHHSDGNDSLPEVVRAAKRFGLDFLSLTDHFTTAGWQQFAGEDFCLMRGLEITGHRGHANMQGMQSWIDPFVDEPSRYSINDAARAVREQGGLFCVNHPYALDLGWRYHEFDWDLCDLLEIYHHYEGEDNTRQLALWDEHLRAGRRITGVAGTDSHDVYNERGRLGQVFTVVHAQALTPAAILEGLRRGAAYVSLGTKMAFTAQSGEQQAGMGEELQLAGVVALTVQLELACTARVVVLKNGWYFRHADLAAGTQVWQLEDEQPIAGYYRVEVYAKPIQAHLGSGREWAQMLCLSNPIYVAER
jgi:PHP domain